MDFIDTLKDTVLYMYEPCLRQEDLDVLDEDMYKLIVGAVVRDKVYKIITIISRIDNEIYDRDMR